MTEPVVSVDPARWSRQRSWLGAAATVVIGAALVLAALLGGVSGGTVARIIVGAVGAVVVVAGALMIVYTIQHRAPRELLTFAPGGVALGGEWSLAWTEIARVGYRLTAGHTNLPTGVSDGAQWRGSYHQVDATLARTWLRIVPAARAADRPEIAAQASPCMVDGGAVMALEFDLGPDPRAAATVREAVSRFAPPTVAVTDER